MAVWHSLSHLINPMLHPRNIYPMRKAKDNNDLYECSSCVTINWMTVFTAAL